MLASAPVQPHAAPCHHHHTTAAGGDTSFAMDASAVVFGRGSLAELGDHARALGLARVALFTDPRLAAAPFVDVALRALRGAGVDVALYAEARVEPTDGSFLDAARFAREARADGYVSVGGGSVIDTCKAAALYAAYPADFLAYVNAPLGEGRPVPGPLPPHIACPTTCGTGSECTGIAVFDLVARHAKTAIASRRLRPSLAVIDPDVTAALPSAVVAASGFDVLSHALESYTARPYTRRPRPTPAAARPMSQGANPWSDLGSLEALRLAGAWLTRAVADAGDAEAREKLMWAATLAGVAFGNAGVHLPHAMSYAVAGLAPGVALPGYPEGRALVPHGLSVILNAPAVFRWTAAASPARHVEAARALGVAPDGCVEDVVGDALAEHLAALVKATGLPPSLGAVGLGAGDVDALAEGAIVQARLVDNAPRPVDRAAMRALFADALGA